MTEKSPYPLPLSEAKKKKKKQKKSAHLKNPELKRLESLPWNESLPGEESFDFIVGSNEGGFLSLEEIDESDYRSVGGVPDPEGGEEPSSSVKIKKRKRGSGGDSVEEDSPTVEAGIEGKSKKRKKPKKKKRKVKEEEKKGEAVHESVEEIGLADTGIASEDGPKDSHAEDDDNESTQLDDDNESTPLDDEFHAWVELRLHPLLIKSIRRLGFKEPTPIQKACIPFAAHQGKDVVGAAETGSGKTLAFGLPILQRLLEERVKAARLHQEEGNATDEYIRGSHLRALIVTPTRELALQVSDHLKEVAKLTNISVVPIVGGMSTEKQERLLKRRPEIIVGTPGRLWELMSGGDQHLVELHSLSFFVLDEADRMIENGHFHELQSIIDLLPTNNGSVEPCSQVSQNCKTVPSLQRKKRQIFVFSATIALPDSFRKKLKGRHLKSKPDMSDELSSIERLSERAGMRADFEKVVLSNSSIVADKLEESFIECTEENKDAYLYYILSVHGHGRTIVFCTSIAALRRISSLLRILGINVWTLHAQMQQRARLKAIDRFRGTEHAILVATDVAARGLDIPGVRTVIHYQLPHSAEVYIHRSGRTARASADGCCIALISPGDRTKFFSLCKALLKESLKRFPLEDSYMPEVMKRVSLSRQIDKILRINSQENLKKSWFERNAESVELMMEESGSEEEQVENHKQKKISSLRLKKLLQELNVLLAQPFHPKTFSRRYLAGAGVSPLLQRQLEELTKQKTGGNTSSSDNKREKLVVIGQDCVEPLQALRSFGHEVSVSADKIKETRRQSEVWKRKKREDKKRQQEQRRKEKRKKKEDK